LLKERDLAILDDIVMFNVYKNLSLTEPKPRFEGDSRRLELYSTVASNGNDTEIRRVKPIAPDTLRLYVSLITLLPLKYMLRVNILDPLGFNELPIRCDDSKPFDDDNILEAENTLEDENAFEDENLPVELNLTDDPITREELYLSLEENPFVELNPIHAPSLPVAVCLSDAENNLEELKAVVNRNCCEDKSRGVELIVRLAENGDVRA
jgi:hypothetical protein